MATHKGACHCGETRFEIEAEIDHVRVCDCSVCTQRGALIFRVAKENFRLLTSWENLGTYTWGTHTGKDYFCRRCGVLPFRKPSVMTPTEIKQGGKVFDGWAVNVRCLTEFDFSLLPILQIKGNALPI